MIKNISNPLLHKSKAKSKLVFNPKALEAPHCYHYAIPARREYRKALRCDTAASAIGKIYPQCAIFGITKGDFSLIELLAVVVKQTGPVTLFVSCWSANHMDMTELAELTKSKQILDVKFLVDKTFQRRQPAYATRMRELFGLESIRVTANHSKICLLRNNNWNIVITTTMNLNMNPRIEHFHLLDDKKLADHIQSFVDEIFTRLKPENIFDPNFINESRFKTL